MVVITRRMRQQVRMPSPFIWGPNSTFADTPPCETDLFAFLDIDHPVVAWAIQRGALVSASYCSPEDTVGFISMMTAGMIAVQNSVRLWNELQIEAIRSSNFPERTSRLRGMCFFRSEADALARIGDLDWPPYFLKVCLVRFRLWTQHAPTIVDANWITYAPREVSGHLKLNELCWAERYWRGEQWGENPVWEGVAVVLDEELRRLCYAETINNFPGATITVLMARLASEAGSRGGLVAPFLFRIDQDNVALRYVFRDAEFHDSQVIAAIQSHADAGALGRMMSENDTWQMPDFRPWGGRMPLSEDASAASAEAHTIHH